MTANDVTNPSNFTFTITYNAEELEAVDLCAVTSRVDMGVGSVIGANVQIVQYTPGTIVFKVVGDMTGQAWTGFINSIKFRSITDQPTQIMYSIE